MRRIAIAIGLCGLLAACGQQSEPAAEGGTGAPLDFIDAVPITEDAPPPVTAPQTAAKKEEPEEDQDEAEKSDDEAAPAQTAAPTPAPAAPSADAATATRRANEAVAPRSETEVPYSPN